LGGLVVSARRFSGAGSPNGPPSHRLAPGGFYSREAKPLVKRRSAKRRSAKRCLAKRRFAATVSPIHRSPAAAYLRVRLSRAALVIATTAGWASRFSIEIA
jgi:hypothetical protein